jgi:hypothetical protein
MSIVQQVRRVSGEDDCYIGVPSQRQKSGREAVLGAAVEPRLGLIAQVRERPRCTRGCESYDTESVAHRC